MHCRSQIPVWVVYTPYYNTMLDAMALKLIDQFEYLVILMNTPWPCCCMKGANILALRNIGFILVSIELGRVEQIVSKYLDIDIKCFIILFIWLGVNRLQSC